MQWSDLMLWLRDHYSIPMAIAFLLILASLFRPRAGERMRQDAMIPLRDDR